MSQVEFIFYINNLLARSVFSSWIREAIAKDFPQQVEIRLTIMSKCNNEADIVDFGGLSNVKVEIIKMPNKGGCDLAYARFISRYLARESSLQGSSRSTVAITTKCCPRSHRELL